MCRKSSRYTPCSVIDNQTYYQLYANGCWAPTSGLDNQSVRLPFPLRNLLQLQLHHEHRNGLLQSLGGKHETNKSTIKYPTTARFVHVPYHTCTRTYTHVHACTLPSRSKDSAEEFFLFKFRSRLTKLRETCAVSVDSLMLNQHIFSRSMHVCWSGKSSTEKIHISVRASLR
jgi:hypothetical protein